MALGWDGPGLASFNFQDLAVVLLSLAPLDRSEGMLILQKYWGYDNVIIV